MLALASNPQGGMIEIGCDNEKPPPVMAVAFLLR
jgi:hypothetical protein